MSSIEEQVDKIWEQYDSNKDGTLNVDESREFYNELIAKRADLGLTADNINDWFGKIDKDSDGTISKPEMTEYLQSINYTQ